MQLPPKILLYYDAQNAQDAETMAACFAPDARVRDEGRDYAGREAILEWKRTTIAKYGISIEPLEMGQDGGKIIVVARAAGNFPGSPVDLTYRFGLAVDGLISTLEIG